ncbi:hypothetical protein CQW23_33965 [Capsicum baccatum]|uniref:TPX2 C-terminal domain-containing protein n=1 Tax=Capsicum baccatum TaxID=33114 RepID=A0A2G2V0C3_CAPBA|nr:hypothetical protein CQW23_33965 [Capsicum baccatum]
MAGGIEEPLRLSFQADSWQFGSISFSRFENEVLCWGSRSSFTQNRYLEKVEKCIKPGSVTEKRAYFEELFRRRALLSQSSSDCQDGADSQASNDGSKNTDYEGDFEHVNEIGHSSCFVENHDRAATLLENGKYQACENEGYARRLEHVNEVGHSARFDENYDSSTHLSKNGKYQADNTGYVRDSERVNEVSSGSKADVLNQHKSTEEQPIARKVVASCASCTERVSHRLYQSVNRDKESVNSRKPVVKQNGSSFRFKTEERAKKRKEARTNFLCLLDKEKKEAEIKQLRRNLNFKATPMPAFYREPGRRSEENKDGQSWEKAGARAAVRGRWRMDQKREILDVLRAKPVIFCVETRSNTPMPAFYREPGRRSEENKDGQSWEEAGARAAVRGRWRMNQKREILDVLRAKPVIFCVETRSNTPMPAFYREPGRRSEENKDGQSWEEAGARTAVRGR